jgi:protein O-GlcNAc transferase
MSKADDRQKLQQAFFLHQRGDINGAAELYRQLIQNNPDNSQALHFLGVIEASIGNIEKAKDLMARSLSMQPPNIQFIENYAAILFQAGDYHSALQTSRQGLLVNSTSVSLLYVSAISLFKLDQLQESLKQFDNLLLSQPDHVAAINERGSVLAAMKQYDAALASVEKALTLNREYAEAYLNKGNLYCELRRYDDALTAYDRALALKAGLAEAWLGRGNACFATKRYEEALAAHDKARALKPDLAEAWLGRGNVYCELKRFDDAFAAYDKALALNPDLAEAWFGRGQILEKIKRHPEAAEAYAKALEIEPQLPFTKGHLLHQKVLCCDWEGIDKLIATIESDVAARRTSTDPFGWQSVATSPRSLQLCAEMYAAHFYPSAVQEPRPAQRYDNQKLRVGYLSGEFREQATSLLIVGMLEQHNKDLFEIFAFDNGPDDGSETRRRINNAVHRIVSIRENSDSQAVETIRQNQIDVLVNLNGYFGEARTRVFSLRAAPIQVNYLGFPGTMGTNYMDYIVADRHVIPPQHQTFYSEKVVYLPGSYQANDSQKLIGTRVLSRAEYGLPEQGFVFCCFNNNYKILPNVFDVWMRLLDTLPDCVLWLLEDNSAASDNLRREATKRGVSPDRLIFAKRAPVSDHLARHRLADLFLDTLPCNAHTTASDALWAGLPVLTCRGETFAGRVAASLLNAIDLPELVATNLETYEALAIELATHPHRLTEIKRKLADNRATTPLFDTRKFTKHIEAAFTEMYSRHQNGLAPDHFSISDM